MRIQHIEKSCNWQKPTQTKELGSTPVAKIETNKPLPVKTRQKNFTHAIKQKKPKKKFKPNLENLVKYGFKTMLVGGAIVTMATLGGCGNQNDDNATVNQTPNYSQDFNASISDITKAYDDSGTAYLINKKTDTKRLIGEFEGKIQKYNFAIDEENKTTGTVEVYAKDAEGKTVKYSRKAKFTQDGKLKKFIQGRWRKTSIQEEKSENKTIKVVDEPKTDKTEDKKTEKNPETVKDNPKVFEDYQKAIENIKKYTNNAKTPLLELNHIDEKFRKENIKSLENLAKEFGRSVSGLYTKFLSKDKKDTLSYIEKNKDLLQKLRKQLIDGNSFGTKTESEIMTASIYNDIGVDFLKNDYKMFLFKDFIKDSKGINTADYELFLDFFEEKNDGFSQLLESDKFEKTKKIGKYGELFLNFFNKIRKHGRIDLYDDAHTVQSYLDSVESDVKWLIKDKNNLDKFIQKTPYKSLYDYVKKQIDQLNDRYFKINEKDEVYELKEFIGFHYEYKNGKNLAKDNFSKTFVEKNKAFFENIIKYTNGKNRVIEKLFYLGEDSINKNSKELEKLAKKYRSAVTAVYEHVKDTSLETVGKNLKIYDKIKNKILSSRGDFDRFNTIDDIYGDIADSYSAIDTRFLGNEYFSNILNKCVDLLNKKEDSRPHRSYKTFFKFMDYGEQFGGIQNLLDKDIDMLKKQEKDVSKDVGPHGKMFIDFISKIKNVRKFFRKIDRSEYFRNKEYIHNRFGPVKRTIEDYKKTLNVLLRDYNR